MLYLLLKTAHILGATLFFGAGLASAFTKWRADRSGNLEAIVFAQRHIVLADWVFTVPSGLLMPATGLWLAALLHAPLSQGFVAWGLALYAVAGACWVPAAVLQLKMRALAEEALRTHTALPARYHRFARAWALLGVPSFAASVAVVHVMVAKQGWF